MFNVDPAGYLSDLGAGIDAEQAHDAANQSLVQHALQAGKITRDQYGEFLAMPRGERSKFVAGIAAGTIDEWKQGEQRLRQIMAQINPNSSWASGIFGEPLKDSKTGAWGTHDVVGNFRAFTPAPMPTPMPPPPPMTLTSSARSPWDKIFATIFGAFGAPSPLASPATPTPTPQPTPTPTPTPRATPAGRSVLMRWPDGVTQTVPEHWIPNAMEQGATPVL